MSTVQHVCADCDSPVKGFDSITTDGVTQYYCHDGDSPTCYEIADRQVWLDLRQPSLERRADRNARKIELRNERKKNGKEASPAS